MLVLTAGGKSAVEAVDDSVVSGILRKPFDLQSLMTAIQEMAGGLAAPADPAAS